MPTISSFVRAGIAGFASALVMFIPMVYLVKVAGVAPFNMPPSAAFADALGINFAPFVPPLLHFAYGVAGGIVYLLLFRDSLSFANALILSGAMWLIMMVIYTPIIGWGVLGFGEAQALPASHPMHLGPAVEYIGVTLAFHVLYAVALWLAVQGLIGRAAWRTA